MISLKEQQAIAARTKPDFNCFCFLVALRIIENGGPQHLNPHQDWKEREENPYTGGEFGVQTLPAPTFGDQLRVAAITLNHKEAIYETAGLSPRGGGGSFTEDFLRWFSFMWAPPGANPLNKDHADHLVKAFRAAIATLRWPETADG